MNIVIDIRSLTEKKRTGVGEYTYELLDAIFSQDSANNYILFFNSLKKNEVDFSFVNYHNVFLIKTNWPNKLLNLFILLKFIKLDLFVAKYFYKIYKKQIEKIDYWFSPNLNFLNLSEHVKTILTIHDLSFEFLPHCFSKKMLLWHKLINPKRHCHQAHLIFTPSLNTKNDLVEMYHCNPNFVKVLYPGISKNFLDNLDKSIDVSYLKNKYNLPENFIFFLGTLEPRKNILSIIQAYSNSNLINKKINLVIAGNRGWKYEKIIKSIDETRGVHYIGYVDALDKPALYKLSKLFLYPSLYEGFGFPVLEAMISGVSVVTSNRSSLLEIVDNNVVLVNPHNVAELKEAMKKNLHRQNKYDKNFLLENFDWDKTAKEFLQNL
ncbi:MAG: glycosyltransferase family 1 protein [Candidatus Magasanikbacteria bacterium]